MTHLFLSAVTMVATYQKARFMRQLRNVEATQTQFLQSILKAHEQTVLGQELGLADIRTIDQFRDRIPVQPYSYFDPYIERMAQGETNVLTAEPVIYFNTISGSTGKRKLMSFMSCR